MKNALIRFQGQVVTVNVKGNVIEMISENDEKLIFEANKDNFSIDYDELEKVILRHLKAVNKRKKRKYN